MTHQDSKTGNESSVRVFVDAHVHIHNCFDIQEFFTAAARNFSYHASETASTAGANYVLCLTETYGVDKFAELSRRAEVGPANLSMAEADWRFERCGDDSCLIARHPLFGDIEIVAGRQIVTAEKLEILALGTAGKWEDGLTAEEIVESVNGSGAIAVLPWGFGKWLGRRRLAVERLIDRFDDGSLYLGDNSGRPGILSNPKEFERARASGLTILPGSDPLPFSSEYDRAGSFGFYLDGVSPFESTWFGLHALLRQGDGELHNYGSLETPLRFVRNQVAMQYLTRVANRWKV